MVKLKLFGFSEGLYIWCVTQWLDFMVGTIHLLKQRSHVLFGKSSYVHYLAFIF